LSEKGAANLLGVCITAAQCAVARAAICAVLVSAAFVSGKRRSREIFRASLSRVGKHQFFVLKCGEVVGALDFQALPERNNRIEVCTLMTWFVEQ
jgi:hypothetical protein